MDSTSIEFSLASAISKKRKHDVCGVSPGQTDSLNDNPNTYDGILDLSARNDFGVEECTVLAKMLSSDCGGDSNKNYFVTELIMSRIGIGPKGGVVLGNILDVNQSLVHLDLERNGLGAAGACSIFGALAANNTLRKLNMSLNDVKAATDAGNDEATRALGNAMSNNSALLELFLVRCGLGPKGGAHLANGLAINESLLRLDLTGNDVMANGGKAIGEALASNATLQELNLRWNRIGCGGNLGIMSLANALRVNVGLRKLDVSVNELYSNGAIAFGEALGSNKSLIFLSLERNEIGVSGALAIGNALGSNTTLECLVISGNPMIGDEGAAAIGRSLAENSGSALVSLEMVGCGLGVEGARALGRALKRPGTPLSSLRIERNKIGADGAAAIADGLGENVSLQHLNLSRNRIQTGGGRALARALRTNRTLKSLDVSNNDIEMDVADDDNPAESLHIVEAIVEHPAIEDVDVSSNGLEIVPIDCQLRLARIFKSKRQINIDLSDNPLSSPPLGRRAGVEGLKAYLEMLLSDSTAVSRIRLMVLGFGGVGKSTFCDAVTQPKDSLPYFHGSLVPLEEWDFDMIAAWASRLGTHWASLMGSLLKANRISGRDLQQLITIQKNNREDGSVISGCDTYEPSTMLHELLNRSDTDGSIMNSSERKNFARAIGSLMRKGYFSTVGAVKLEGLLELNQIGNDEDRHGPDHEGESNSEKTSSRKCSLVDFAGQMEYLVSHQLLLSSLHTLCVVLQPAPSFGNSQSRHHGSWMYWSRFLRALGDRRRGSLLLAVSQLDKVALSSANRGDGRMNDVVHAAIEDELKAIRSSIANISDSPPLCLDYRPEHIQETIEEVRGALLGAADVVARDWWVPTSYETLAELVRKIEDEKKSNREVPIVSRKELHRKLPSVGLHRMHEDPQLFRRGIEYLEAVGDVMTDDRLDCLLLDPISWFASFLAHFIRDDDIVTSVQLDARLVRRGVVGLEDVVAALQHDYAKPREQVAQIMSLVCSLELCIRCNDEKCDKNGSGEFVVGAQPETTLGDSDGITNDGSNLGASSVSYLFPCLLPPVTSEELVRHWPAAPDAQQLCPFVYRGHRFRSRNGFFPPGLFPGLLARCRFLSRGILRPHRMWKNCAVLVFRDTTRVLLRIDLATATLDVVGAAPTPEELFVGAAKGQASVVVWMTHLVKMFLRRSYPQLEADEFFLCTSAECHATNTAHETPKKGNDDDEVGSFHPCRSCYNGMEFPAEPVSGKLYKGNHSCEADGCWSQVGVGHKIERMVPRVTKLGLRCVPCQKEARFALRT